MVSWLRWFGYHPAVGIIESYVDDMFMMRSPIPILAICISYLFFVLKCGPKFMENRPAYNLRNILLVYNALQVALSWYLFKFGADTILEYGIVEKGFCFNTMNEDNRKKLFYGSHIYFLAKATELLDTVFFVLRKKWDQISFLHVYHHSFMFVASWLFLKYAPSYTFVFLGTLNSFVHVVMYTYYGLSAFPSLAEHLWWKKYITKMQLMQFIAILIHIIWNYIVSSCPPPYILLYVALVHFILFMYLFLDFYFKSYTDTGKVDSVKERSKEQ